MRSRKWTSKYIYTNTPSLADTYFTDFMDLSNFPAELLAGDSFLLLRKASRFFMSLALREGGTEKENCNVEGKKIGGKKRSKKDKR